MLINLACKNVGKGYRDYGVYFFTLSFGVCIFYLFSHIVARKHVMGKKLSCSSLSFTNIFNIFLDMCHNLVF